MNVDHIHHLQRDDAFAAQFTRRGTAVQKLETVQHAALAELDALFATLPPCAF